MDLTICSPFRWTAYFFFMKHSVKWATWLNGSEYLWKTQTVLLISLSSARAFYWLFFALFVFALVIAVAAYVSSWQYTDGVISVGVYVSIASGAFYMGSKLKHKLWLHGILVGVIFLVVVTVLRADFSLFLRWTWFKQLLLVSLCGLLGSVIGGIFNQ